MMKKSLDLKKRIRCGWCSPLQVFISNEVFYLHLSDLVVVQAQLCDGGREVWEIQNHGTQPMQKVD